MFEKLKNKYRKISDESLEYLKNNNAIYSRPNLRDYAISLLLAILLPLPFHLLLAFVGWKEYSNIPNFLILYVVWVAYAYIIFTCLFVIPDRIYRLIGEVLYIKEKVDEKPWWIEWNEWGPGRKQDKQTPAFLWCGRWRIVSYILFLLLATVIPAKILPNHYKSFPLISLSIAFTISVNWSFFMAFSIISFFSNPKREFSPKIVYNFDERYPE
ncbi:MAG: hypothetical protein GY705_21625 [Bacteroidetes bacterium]|nr:hypothetical protein [Bacteroidota bacterium]